MGNELQRGSVRELEGVLGRGVVVGGCVVEGVGVVGWGMNCREGVLKGVLERVCW